MATRAPKDHSESEASVYARWAAELAEQGIGERQLTEVCSGGWGRPANRTELDTAPTTPPTEGPADSQRGSAERRRYREEGRGGQLTASRR